MIINELRLIETRNRASKNVLSMAVKLRVKTDPSIVNSRSLVKHK